MESFGLRLFAVILFMTLLSSVLGHSYLTAPTSRSNQGQSNTGCRGPACLGPCDIPLSQTTRAPITIARGASITANWPRNNHAGGFIRFAWAPTAQSDSMSAFDNNVQQINCHEVGACHPDSASDPNGGDSGPSDGSSRACSISFAVPTDLTDGKWTLQWAWFGGAFSLGDYYSCVDYTISGGPTGASVSPVFIGGDYTYPGQNKCKFFNTDQLHKCVDEPCSNPGPLYPASAEESGPAANIASTPASPPATPSTTGKVATPSSTTGKVSTPSSTTGKVSSPSTTGKVSTPSTTGKKASGSSSSSSSTSSSSSSNCTLGHMRCASSSTYQTCAYNAQAIPTYGVVQPCQSGLICQQSENGGIYCTRPGETIKEVNSGSRLTSSLWFALTFVVAYLAW